MQALQTLGPLGLSERPATTQRVGESGAPPRRFRNERKNAAEVVLKQMFKQTGGHACAEVGLGVGAPLSREAPNLIRVLLVVILNADDGLPTWV
jgi:hypothetical protein